MCSNALAISILLVLSARFPAIAAPVVPCDAKAVFAQASELLSKQQFNEAYEMLQELDICKNLSAADGFQLGWLYGRARHFAEALKQFRSVPVDIPDKVTHEYAVALSEFELGHYDLAAGVLRQLKSQSPLDEKCANLLGVSYSKLGKYAEAYATFDETVRSHPGDLTAYLNEITLCVDGGNVQKAAALASTTASAFPNSPQAFVVLGSADLLLGRLDEAHNAFASAVHIAPLGADARFFEALTSYKQDRLDTAIQELTGAELAGLNDSDLHYLKAECLIRRDPADTEVALAELNRAISLNADSVSAHVLRGKLELAAGEKEKALRDLEAAREADPKSRSATYNLARTYQALGRTVEARALLQQISKQAGDPLSELGDRRLNNTLKGDPAR